ncbi:MAG: adenylate/guanylate cyclase domain-containing protein [Actinobacteria bacterium]|nr:adenylate/guanylate cyclase domain-containing protein [Actinomycetota bacterium]
MRTELPSGTVTFLFTDIAGSTRLLKDVGPEAYARELAVHRTILRAGFEEHGGVEVDTQGDAFFVAFGTAAGAVAAAGAGQRALHAGPIVVRMGLHTGAPSVTPEGYVGIDVHRGARIAALAHGGQVLMSAPTAALLEDEPLLDLGLHRLKDFDAPAQLFQLGAEQFPPVRTPGAVDLPTPITPFLGRERELFAAAALWLDRGSRVLTIVGPGGTGKTRFAIELARFLAEQADGGSVFVPLAPVRDPALVVPLIAERVGASGDSAGAIATRLGDRRTHVVLDNLEQLLPDAAKPLSELLSAAPSLHILATSREPLHVSGETEFDLQPMDEADAIALFLERAQAIRPEIADAAPVRELIHRLDRLPLAIELAAARVKLLGPEQLLERIGQRLDLLKGGRDADVRHATLRATIAWSYDLLVADEQLLFARLAIFRGGSTLADAERICDAEVETVGSLLDKSLLRRRTEPDGTDRFWMLETIGEFARECLAATGEEATLRRRQADQLIALADRAGTRAVIERPQRWDFDSIAPEIDNVRAVLEWAAITDPARGLHLAAWLEAYWVVRDPVEGTRWLGSLLERAPNADPILRAHAMRALGGVNDIFGRPDDAAPWYRQSLELFVEHGAGPQAAHGRFRIRVEHGDEGRRGSGVASDRRLPWGSPKRRSAARRVPGARTSCRKGRAGGRPGARARAGARERGESARSGLDLVGGRTAPLGRRDRAQARQPRRVSRACSPLTRAVARARRPAQRRLCCCRARRSCRVGRRRETGGPALGGDRDGTRPKPDRAVGRLPEAARSSPSDLGPGCVRRGRCRRRAPDGGAGGRSALAGHCARRLRRRAGARRAHR